MHEQAQLEQLVPAQRGAFVDEEAGMSGENQSDDEHLHKGLCDSHPPSSKQYSIHMAGDWYAVSCRPAQRGAKCAFVDDEAGMSGEESSDDENEEDGDLREGLFASQSQPLGTEAVG